jgi:hypothetical protein
MARKRNKMAQKDKEGERKEKKRKKNRMLRSHLSSDVDTLSTIKKISIR